MSPFRREELPPLENPLVLEVVFGHCSVDDLKVCRQVSKVWRDSSLHAWRSSVRVKIGAWAKVSMSEFLELVQNENRANLETPFLAHYAVYEHAQELWDLCGSSVKTLELCELSFQSLDVFRRVIFESCPNLENLTLSLDTMGDLPIVTEEPTEFLGPQFGEHMKLKSLTLMDARDPPYDWGKCPISWMELLSYFPSLETLRVEGDIPKDDELFRSLALIREYDSQKLQLKHVSVVMMGCNQLNSTSFFHALQDPRLGLVSLDLAAVCFEDCIEVQKILRTHASSLKELTLDGDDSVDLADCFRFLSPGQLGSLQNLNIERSYPLTMNFLKCAPNLKTLQVQYYGSLLGELDLSEMAGVNLTKCKELRISGDSVTADQIAVDLRIVARWMPNIEILKIKHLGNNGFGVVCEQWPNLVSLTVYLSDVDDSGITGLDAEDVARINEEGFAGTWRPITVPRANITALKRLRSVHLTGNWHTGTDLGCCSALGSLWNYGTAPATPLDY